ncbi:MAG TPA: PAS domain S-box protein [Candidatus Paceibacterota bacterium]|nr:PAS domain S-box protein [Candidatus Paceibacterota bacterium]
MMPKTADPSSPQPDAPAIRPGALATDPHARAADRNPEDSSCIRILLIDDDRGEFLLTRRLLSKVERQKYELHWAASYAEGQLAIQGNEYDVFLVDYRLGERSGMDLLREARASGQMAPIILLTGQGDLSTDVEAMRAGASDYLVKGELNAALLERSIRYALERTRAIQKQRESDERYRTLVETSPDAIVCTDLTGKIFLANQMAAKSQGLGSVKEMLGRRVFDFLAAEDRDRAIQTLNDTIQTGLSQTIEFTLERADGSHYPVEASSARMIDALGRPIAVISIFRDIAERRRAEGTLRKLSRAVEQTADHLFITDREGVIEYVNPAFERLTGYSLSEAVGQTPRILKSGYHSRAFFQELWDTILGGQVFRSAFTNRKKNGEVFYEEQTITPILDPQGLINFFVATGHDITARKKAEEALRTTEARYRSIFENAIEGIYQCAPNGHYLTANPALAHMLGFDSQETFLTSLASGHHQLYVDPHRRQDFLRLVADQDEVSNFEAQVFRRDGRIIWISENARAVRDALGEIVHYEGTVENITQRKQAEQDMLRLAAFPQWNPNPVLEFSAEGNLSYFNHAAQNMAESLQLDHPQDMLPPQTAQLARDCLATGKSIIQREVRMDDRTFYWSFFPILANQVIHCYVEDVTERHDLESRLRHSQKMESIGQLAAGVAHDFNNLLTIIQGQACLVLAKSKLDARAETALQQIVTASERAANLTRQLLAFSRRQPMQPLAINLNEVIHNLARMLQRILGDDVSLEFNSGQNLPAILADVSMMEQVIMNLVVNARDAMPKGGRLILRTASLFITDDYAQQHPEAQCGPCVCLSVTDTGCGMDDAVLARIFEPFFTTKDIGKGTGLGLATVYGIIKQHQGWLEVESQVGRGSTFKVFLPATPEIKAATSEGAVPPEYQGGSETILVVEDEPSLRSLIEEILTALGYTVLKASSGVEALNQWRSQRPPVHLLITDMVMPEGISGRELADALLAEIPDLKVIFISGYSVDLSMPGFTLAEGVNFLQKPFSPYALARTSRDVLDGRPMTAPV